tara:strand:+ start:55596 stop:56486 length:891 start_codon:yes stop_codon:yes gene_type:complete
MSISKVQGVDISSVSSIDSIQKSTISQLNDVDVPSGFAVDYSVDLNGSSQYIDLGNQTSSTLNPSQASINSSGLTLTAWVYIDSLSGGEYIYDLGNCCTNSYYGLKMVVNGNGSLVFHVMGLNQGFAGSGSNNRNTCRTANSAVSAGQWYHLAIVVPSGSMGSTQDRDEWRIYKNGSVVNPSTYVKSGNQNVTLAYNGNSSLGVWRRASNTNYFDGEMNNYAVFATALNATNIAAIYNSGAPIDLSTNSGNYNQSSNLTAWWRFNEGTGTSYADSSTNSFTGSGVNTPTWSTNVPT